MIGPERWIQVAHRRIILPRQGKRYGDKEGLSSGSIASTR
jgi:hypothetical protein